MESYQIITNYNQENLKNKISNVIFNKVPVDDEFLEFYNLINVDYISISGSTILQILSNTDYKNSDLDIYIEVDKFIVNGVLDKKKLQNIITIIHILNCKLQNYNQKTMAIYTMRLLNCLKNFQNNLLNSQEIVRDQKYSNLRKYLKLLLPFKSGNKKVELIFISKSIDIIINKTFDYDIVQNYWKQDTIYCKNINAIYTKTATMTLSHFINRILMNPKEFLNFEKRYEKYTNRGYNIFIHKTFITNKHFLYIYNIYKSKNYYRGVYPTLYSELSQNRYYSTHIRIHTIQNNKLIKLRVEKKEHIIKYILISGVMKKYRLCKNILHYSNYILDDYYHPTSPYILYLSNTWINNNKKKQIGYVSNNKKLKLLSY